MPRKHFNGKKDIPDEHLTEYLKSSYTKRLNWLEEANNLTFHVLNAKEKRFREKVRKGLV